MANLVNRVIGLLAYSLSFMSFFSVQFKYSVQPVIVIKLCFLIPFSIDLYYISCFPRSKFCMVFAFPYFRFTLPQAPENLNFFFFPRTNYQNNTSAVWVTTDTVTNSAEFY